jgi:DNA replication licensing factor MCM3
MSMVKPKI